MKFHGIYLLVVCLMVAQVKYQTAHCYAAYVELTSTSKTKQTGANETSEEDLQQAGILCLHVDMYLDSFLSNWIGKRNL